MQKSLFKNQNIDEALNPTLRICSVSGCSSPKINVMQIFVRCVLLGLQRRSFRITANGCKYGKAGIKSADLSSRDKVN